jgi:NADPH-dependent ferric siderophore reductase
MARQALRDVSWTPGDKIQILLSTLDVRTYTPSAWDARAGIAEIIAFEHGDSPGAVWSRRVAVGDACRFVGPQRSVRRAARPGVLFGD